MNRQELSRILGFSPSDEQWAAIAAPPDGPLLVLAGAGSGKTSVMSARVLWLVGSGLVAPEEVLGLTFTNKAASELAGRVRSLLARLAGERDAEQGEPTISTFHAFAVDLLSQYGLLVGAEPSATLLNPTDLAVTTYTAVARSEADCERLGSSHLPTLRKYIQNLDDQMSEHLIEAEQLREHDELFLQALEQHDGRKDGRDMAEAARKRILASRVVQESRAARQAAGVVSFADLMRHAVAISEVPRVREQLRERFKAVLVDEYQDTSVAQALMLRNLFGDGFPLTAVGDPLQAIYGWRGASVANIDAFPTDFAADIATLSINRRSTPVILDAANAVAAPVRVQHPDVKILHPAEQRPGTVAVGLFGSWADEVAWLVARIREERHAGRDWEQIAVLCRSNTYVEDIASRLRQEDIPVAAASLGSVLETPEVVEVLSVLRVLQESDNASLVRLLTGPQWRIGPSDMVELGRRARELAAVPDPPQPADFTEALARSLSETDPVDVVSLLDAVYDPGPQISVEASRRLRAFRGQLDAIRPALATGVDEAAHRIVDVTGLSVEVRLGPNAAAHVDGMSALFDLIAGYRTTHSDPGVQGFLMWLDRAVELDAMPDAELPVRGKAVQVMTVHRAKGLEWDCVFVPALSKGVFPSSKGRYPWTTHYEELPYPLRGDRARLPVLPGWRAPGDDLDVNITQAAKSMREQYREQDDWEENRLAYVALTRAGEVMYATGHWWSKEVKAKEPSEYLLTLRDVPGVTEITWVPEQPEQPAGLLPGDVPWPVSDVVYTVIDAPDSADDLTADELRALAQMDKDVEAVTQREREQSRAVTCVDLPRVMSASMLMRAAKDPAGLALDLARPMPTVSSPEALRGTAFHEWVARSNEQLGLFPDWETAIDAQIAGEEELAELIEGYRRTGYAQMTPYATEIEVVVKVAGTMVRGFIDAVYLHADGTWEIVDWKTNRQQNADPLQLAIYRLGWAQRAGAPEQDVVATFVYVRDAEAVRPQLPDRSELEAQLLGLQ